jgi:hypothetical protein
VLVQRRLFRGVGPEQEGYMTPRLGRGAVQKRVDEQALLARGVDAIQGPAGAGETEISEELNL